MDAIAAPQLDKQIMVQGCSSFRCKVNKKGTLRVVKEWVVDLAAAARRYGSASQDSMPREKQKGEIYRLGEVAESNED